MNRENSVIGNCQTNYLWRVDKLRSNLAFHNASCSGGKWQPFFVSLRSFVQSPRNNVNEIDKRQLIAIEQGTGGLCLENLLRRTARQR